MKQISTFCISPVKSLLLIADLLIAPRAAARCASWQSRRHALTRDDNAVSGRQSLTGNPFDRDRHRPSRLHGRIGPRPHRNPVATLSGWPRNGFHFVNRYFRAPRLVSNIMNIAPKFLVSRSFVKPILAICLLKRTRPIHSAILRRDPAFVAPRSGLSSSPASEETRSTIRLRTFGSWIRAKPGSNADLRGRQEIGDIGRFRILRKAHVAWFGICITSKEAPLRKRRPRNFGVLEICWSLLAPILLSFFVFLTC